MFVALEYLIIKSNDATNIAKSSETNLQGRRTGESTAVLSRHRFECSSSDLPSLFNFKLTVMLEQNGQNQSSASAHRENQIECLIENLADVAYSDLGQVMVNVNTAICSYVKQHPHSSSEMLSALNDISLMCMAINGSREFINNECKRIETEVQL